VHKLHLPRLGQTMERGTILRWFKRDGEPFAVGEPLYEVESEKASIEVEAKLPGTLARIVAPEQEELPVGVLLAVVADPGESLSAEQVEAAIAEEKGEVAAAPGPAVRMRIMPRARTLAQQLGLDLASLKGSGPGGSITVEDVQRAAAPAGGPRVRERRPLRGIPRTMAEVVTRSWLEVPQFVQVVLVDASGLVARRQGEAETVERQHGVTLSYTDLVLEAVVKAATEVPEANASFADDAIILYEDVNIAVAVATDAGLVVPVIHRAQELSLEERVARLRDLSERARAGALAKEDVRGGTITVSNLGMFGVESGTPLVMAPQATIVFAGAIVERPVVIDGSIQARPTLYVSTAFDHRVLDGASAARFTGALKQHLERP
jgi:pyruvate dehydrogenase E2 component (dihydrolipoamide acetyltransferase)